MPAPRTEFAQALRAIASERGLDAEVILETIKQAIIAAYRRDAKERGEDTEEMEFEVELDPRTGEAKIFAYPPEKPEEKKDVTPPGFGRIAAQTAKQVIHQKIREAEKGAIMDEYEGRVGSLISGMILRFDGSDVRVDLGRAEGIMPAKERVPDERLNPNQRLSFLLKDIQDGPRGKQLVLSRADPLFVQKLFEREVPEMSSGSVEVKAIAREAGVRTKMAVFSNQSGVDPVGSCVGQKGVRVQAVTNELGGERVDIIPWSDNTADLVKASLSPAENLSVTLDEKDMVAKVKAPEDQLSLAIGRDGQNARLAAKLTGWKIEIKELAGGETKGEEEKADADKEKGSDKKTATTEKTQKSTEDTKKEKGVKKGKSKKGKKEEPESEIEKVEKEPKKSKKAVKTKGNTDDADKDKDEDGKDKEVSVEPDEKK
jgi:N utilization substance protein A